MPHFKYKYYKFPIKILSNTYYFRIILECTSSHKLTSVIEKANRTKMRIKNKYMYNTSWRNPNTGIGLVFIVSVV